MVRLALGHRDAFAVVFEGLWPHLLRFVTRAMNGHPDAEDVAQQTLLKIFARVSDFDVDRDAVAWAFGIAGYEVKTLRRQLQRRREAPQTPELPSRAPTPEEAAIDRDLRDPLAEALGELSHADRTALLDDRSALGSAISPVAWRKRRQRALERLRTIWVNRHA